MRPLAGNAFLRPLQKRRRSASFSAHGDGGGAGGAQHGAHAADFLFDLFGRAVALAQQDGFGREVVAGLHEVLHRGGHRLVHHLEAGRNDAGGDHVGHRVAGFAHVVEAGHDAAREQRLGDELDGHFGRHGEHALAADHGGQQVVAGHVERVAAEGDGLALGREALHLEHVVHRQAVFEAVHAARVLGHVAADGAGDLAARVGRVVEAVRRGGLADREVAHAALHDGGAADRVDLQDAVELGQRQRHAQGVRHGAARQARARAARHHGHGQAVAGLQHGLHLVIGFGQRHHQRALAVGGQAVAFVGRGVFAVPQQRVRRQVLQERLHHLGLERGARRRRGGCRGGRGRRGGRNGAGGRGHACHFRRCGAPPP